MQFRAMNAQQIDCNLYSLIVVNICTVKSGQNVWNIFHHATMQRKGLESKLPGSLNQTASLSYIA